jgi:uncharacterized peroxidase-related enzyme
MIITMPLLSSLPENATWADLEHDYGDLLRPIGQCIHRVMRGASPLSVGERQLIGAYVSGLNRCRICFETHVLVAESFGMGDEAALRSLVDDVDTAAVDARLKPLLRYVRKLTEEPTSLTQPDADAVFAAGWSERALFDAILVCGLYNYLNRVADGTGIVGTPELYPMFAQELLSPGYRERRLFRLIAAFDAMKAALRSWFRFPSDRSGRG